jgi:uncharacterized membrane protein
VERKTERKLLVTTSIWHFINGLLTIFVFGMWFKTNGDVAINQMYPELVGGSSSFVDILYTVLTSYSIFIILIGLGNIYFKKRLRDNEIQRKWQGWLFVMIIFSFLSFDVIGSLLYLVTFVTYSSKNKAIQLSQNKIEQYQLVNGGLH